MKVTAISPAFYNGSRVRVGDVVDVPEGFKASWFVKPNTPEAEAAKPKKAKAEPKALSELNKADVQAFADVHKGDLA